LKGTLTFDCHWENTSSKSVKESVNKFKQKR